MGAEVNLMAWMALGLSVNSVLNYMVRAVRGATVEPKLHIKLFGHIFFYGLPLFRKRVEVAMLWYLP